MKQKAIAIALIFAMVSTASACMMTPDSSVPPGTIDFRVVVTGNSGAPLSGAKVVSETQPDGQLKITGLTDDSGNVTFTDVRPGAYRFTISRFNYEQTEVSVIVTTANTELKVKMTPVAGSPGTT